MEDVHAFDVSIEATILPMDSVLFLVEVTSVLRIALCQEVKMPLALAPEEKDPPYHPVRQGVMFGPPNGLVTASM